jgi:hypothetical protein
MRRPLAFGLLIVVSLIARSAQGGGYSKEADEAWRTFSMSYGEAARACTSEMLSGKRCNSIERCDSCLRDIKRVRSGGDDIANADVWIKKMRASDKKRRCYRALLGDTAYQALIDWMYAYANANPSLNKKHNILRDCREAEFRKAVRGLCS